MLGRRRGRRWVEKLPPVNHFMPNIPYNRVVFLRVEEFEAIRPVYHIGLSQQKATAQMGISQKSLSNDRQNARFKLAGALVHGKAIRIQGGNYAIENFIR